MPSREIVELIKKEMKGWDGTGEDAVTEWGERHDWALKMYKWGRKVRRDILVIEHHLKTRFPDLKADGFFLPGDPGDPPPPPPDM